MIKRYLFPTEQQTQGLILGLCLEPNQTTSKDIQGIVLDIPPSLKYDEEGEVIEVEHLTYDVDIMWRNEPIEEWQEFEVEPETPNHNFM